MSVLYTVTVFLSAALLFVLEPMFARMVLPRLGGSPAVWNTAMVFYQVVLLAGYAYAHLATRWLGVRRQRWLHLAVLLLPILALPIRVPAGWTPPTESNPVLWLLALMGLAVGLPFFAVSTSGSLLQKWFSTTRAPGARDPYFLYAASNLGSLVGLLAYPLVVEPRLRLGDQSGLWSAAYGVFVLLTIACALAAGRGAGGPDGSAEAARTPDAPAPEHDAAASPQGGMRWGRRLRWIALACVPSSLMLGVTQHLSTDVAAMPLLWVVPLAIYLVSFILVFSPRPLVPGAWVSRALPFVVVIVMITILYGPERPLALVMAIHVTGLLVMATACHGALARDRPGVEHLTEFYLWLAVGGALGGLFNALIAPAIFSTVAEYPIAVALAGAVVPALVAEPGERRERMLDLVVPLVIAGLCVAVIALARAVSLYGALADTRLIPALLMLTLLSFGARPLRFGLGVLALYAVGHIEPGQGSRVLLRERTFFGVHRVVLEPEPPLHTLFHGTTVHGVQRAGPGWLGEPLGYYHYGGPVGQVFGAVGTPRAGRRVAVVGLEQVFGGGVEPPRSGRRVAVVGLGAGTLAAYAEPGDHWTFYEIDPTVARIAQDPSYFTYLSRSRAPWRVVLGDARQSLEVERDPPFDLMILDAYSSDAVPVHLLTREALRLYLDHLAPHGVLAFHISSRHFHLGRVVSSLAQDAGLVYRVRDEDPVSAEETRRGLASASCAVVARTLGDLGALAHDPRWKEPRRRAAIPVWTDDYSSLFPVIAWR